MSSLDGLQSGISTTITLTLAGIVQGFTILHSFQSREDSSVLKKVAIDGTTRHPKLFQGFSGSMTFERHDPFFDDYIVNAARNYSLGGDQVNFTVIQTVDNPDGTSRQYEFGNVVITQSDAGSYTGEDIVMQTADFVCSTKRRLA